MSRFHPLTVREVRRETDDTVSILFDVPDELKDAFKFQHGQYLTLKYDMEGEELRRSYSICSGVPEGELRVAVKSVPGGKFSTWANTILRQGGAIDVMAPMGRFTTPLEPDRAKSYVLFAAGSGITPVMSIIKTVLALEPKSDITLFYGNRSTGSIIFREQIEDLKNRFMGRLRVFHVLSREKQDLEVLNGRIDQEKSGRLLDVLTDVEDTDSFFLCGPEGMIEDVRASLAERGVDKKKVHFELFTTPGATPAQVAAREEQRKKAEASGETTRVTVVMDGDRWEFDMPRGESVLEAGHDAGLDLPFACKGGVCATCRAKVVDGSVTMEENWGLDDEEVEQGFVLTCQSHPTSDRLTVDFDER